METRVLVEKYVKRQGGKFYCQVHFIIGKTTISVGEIATDDTEKAKKKAKEILDSATKLF